MSGFEMEHSYARHWSEHYLSNPTHSLPGKKIFSLDSGQNHNNTQSLNNEIRGSRSDDSGNDSEDEIDVCDISDDRTLVGSVSWHCAEQKARMQMNECERHVASSNKSTNSTVDLDKESYWDENLNKSHWNIEETKLFNRTVKILLDEKLARLSYKESSNEIVLRRLSVDRSASRLRNVFISVNWKLKLTQWLHTIMMDNLPTFLLACYLDIIQTLRSKVPSLVERMIGTARDVTNTSSERLNLLLKRPWDPAVTAVVSTARQKPSQPILFIVLQCNVTQSAVPIASRRLRFWNSLLSQIGKVVQVVAPSDEAGDDKSSQTVEQLAQRMFHTISAKVRDLSARNANRKVVLVGWHTTSVINCQVALKQQVAAVICMGFPIYTMFGRRGEIDDVLCDITTPTLFIVGDQASFCDVNDLEDLREKTFTDAMTSSLVVGGADDWLKVSEKRKRQCRTTQPMADRKMLEGIYDFLNSIFSPYNEREESSRTIHTGAGFSRKRPMHDTHEYEGKRHRSSSPHVVLHRHSSTSSQINQFLSDQKRSTEQEGDASKLHGLSFDLQTGSVSGLTSVPGSVMDTRPTQSSSSKRDRPSTALKTSKKESQASRSITIDLTKDTNEQLPSTSSQRKPQLLQPTEQQTEDAIAAILGGSGEKPETINLTSDTEETSPSPNTAAMAPSSSFGSISDASAAATQTSKITVTPTLVKESSSKYTFGTGKFGNLVSKSDLPPARSGFKPIRTGLGRFSSVDQSVISRTRREDRETQQATAILEQLTSSLDADRDPDSRSGSPELLLNRFNSVPSQRKDTGVSRRRSSSAFPQAAKSMRNQRACRVRTRGGHLSRENSSNRSQDGARKFAAVTTKGMEKPMVRYVVTSPSLRGSVQKRGGASGPGGGRRITLMPEFGSALFAAATTKSSALRHIAPHSKPTAVKTPPKLERATSSNTLSDAILASYSSHKATADHRPKKVSLAEINKPSPVNSSQVAASSKSSSSLQAAPKGDVVRHVVYLKEKGPVKGSPALQSHTLVAGGSKAVAKLITGRSGDRALLSITRPRSVSAGTSKTVVVSYETATRTLSDSNQLHAKVGMPSLVLTKIASGSVSKTEGSASKGERPAGD